MNILLITVDCLRADHLSCMGYRRQTSPFIDSLAESGILFTQAIINGVGTFASFPALMTSTHPFMHGGYEKVNRKMIAEVLQERGYITAGFNDNSFLSPYFGYDKGFDYFKYLNAAKRKGLASKTKMIAKRIVSRNARTLKFATMMKRLILPEGGGMGGARLTSEVLSWLSKNHPTNFFLWIHYMDVHGAHYAPREYFLKIGFEPPAQKELVDLNSKLGQAAKSYKEGRIGKREIDVLAATYDAEIRYVDDRIEELFNKLSYLGIDKNTAIIITGDHGEEFFEHGDYHSHENFYDEMLRVPLVICGPDIAHKRIDKQVEHIDIAPTILHLLDEDEEGAFIGKSLLGNNPGSEYVITEVAPDYMSSSATQRIIKINFDVRKTSIRSEKGNGKWKYINSTKENKEELYDLTRDPTEKDNSIDRRARDVQEILGESRERLQAHFKLEEEQMRVKQRIRILKNGRHF
jgi:arylsulfatase A-like enzyme